MMKTIILFLLIILPLSGQEILTVEEALKIGLKNNFDIRMARNTAEIAQNNQGKGTAGFLPTLDAVGDATYSENNEETNSPFSFGNTTTKNYMGSLSLNWTLFDGFKMFTNKRRYNQLAEMGIDQARNQIETSVVEIMRAYFNLVQQSQLLDVAKENLEISKSRLNKEEVRSNIGGLSSTDLLNARVTYNNDRSTYLNQELQLEIALKNLNIALGRSPETEVLVQKEIFLKILTLKFEEILELSQEKNSALSISRRNQEIAKDDIELSKSVFYPRISLKGGASYRDRNITRSAGQEITSNSTNYEGGFQLSWNLFNGMQNSIDVQNAKIQEKNSRLKFEKTKNIIAGLVREKYDSYQKRLLLMTLESENVEAAQQNLERQQERYDLGTTTSLDFRDAQIKLVRAQASYIVARYQTRISRLEIDQLTGNLEIE
ncbi:TolC family protein [bacterium]|nr:TolC family protein [bacterium]